VSSDVLIFGSSGYLGRHFLAAFPGAVAPRTDIADPASVAAVLDLANPRIVINCAGRTGRPNIDWCETHKEETLRSNVLGPLVLLQECRKRGIYLVQLGSGCLYQGDNGGRGFTEEDPPNFSGSFYSRSKSWIDQVFKEFPVLTLRLRMPFDGSGSPRCLLTKLSAYRRVLVEKNSMTHLEDFLPAAQALIERRAIGVFNVVNEGALSPFEVMSRYRDLVDPEHDFEPLHQEELSQVAQAGRSNCLLDTSKLRREGLGLPPLRQAVESALRRLARARAAGQETALQE
jgi:3,5-epimerase/4-reductase